MLLFCTGFGTVLCMTIRALLRKCISFYKAIYLALRLVAKWLSSYINYSILSWLIYS